MAGGDLCEPSMLTPLVTFPLPTAVSEWGVKRKEETVCWNNKTHSQIRNE